MTVGAPPCYDRGSPTHRFETSVITRFAMTNAWNYRRATNDDIVELASWRGAGSLAGHTVIEVGPGPGGLTRALLAEGSHKGSAIERDARALPAIAAAADGQ